MTPPCSGRSERRRIAIGSGVFDLSIDVGPIPDSSAPGVDLLVAIVQDRGRLPVLRGENGGRTLAHVAIARSRETIGPVATTGGSAQTVVHVPAVIGATGGTTFSVVAFLRERGSRACSAPRPLRSRRA